jgi:hypothetical protein
MRHGHGMIRAGHRHVPGPGRHPGTDRDGEPSMVGCDHVAGRYQQPQQYRGGIDQRRQVALRQEIPEGLHDRGVIVNAMSCHLGILSAPLWIGRLQSSVKLAPGAADLVLIGPAFPP